MYGNLSVRFGIEESLYEWSQYENIKDELFGHMDEGGFREFKIRKQEIHEIITMTRFILKENGKWRPEFNDYDEELEKMMPNSFNADDFLFYGLIHPCAMNCFQKYRNS